jgi:hypothetical protein
MLVPSCAVFNHAIEDGDCIFVPETGGETHNREATAQSGSGVGG